MPMFRLRTTLIGLTCAAGLAALGGCGSSAGASASASGPAMDSSSMSAMGSSSDGSSAGSNASSSAVVIHISKFAYHTPASVSPGATVTVMNMDAEAHTVTADSGGAFDLKIDPGTSATFRAPMKPGTYAFHCTYHSNMHGMLVVR
jgi:plastocyanin